MSLGVGIEIGGTKLQAGVGLRDERLLGLARATVDPNRGAEGIREALPSLVDEAIRDAGVAWGDIGGVGVGFGGPVDSSRGVTLVSHQIDGWRNFPLAEWLRDRFGVPVSIQNDASLAGYAEAKRGAGRGKRRVFYVTVGSGIGGGWIVDGVIDEGQGVGAAEIGHTWVCDPDCGDPEKLEAIASGWSIGQRAQETLEEGEESILTQMCDGDIERVDARMVHEAATQGDLLATALLNEAADALALGIGNAITLLHPEVVVIGGGVSLMGDALWAPLREKVERYAFHLFTDSVELRPAQLGEEVVVIGGALLASETR